LGRVPSQIEVAAARVSTEPRVTLRVESEPAGARVTREDTGELLGTTPLSVPVAATQRLGLVLSLEGYAEEHRALSLASDASLKVSLTRLP
jgi:serine/threonine-protein kinase